MHRLSYVNPRAMTKKSTKMGLCILVSMLASRSMALCENIDHVRPIPEHAIGIVTTSSTEDELRIKVPTGQIRRLIVNDNEHKITHCTTVLFPDSDENRLFVVWKDANSNWKSLGSAAGDQQRCDELPLRLAPDYVETEHDRGSNIESGPGKRHRIKF